MNSHFSLLGRISTPAAVVAGWLFLLLPWSASVSQGAASFAKLRPGIDFRESRILVKAKAEVDPQALNRLHQARSNAVLRAYPNIGNLQVLRLRPGANALAEIARYQESGLVEYAEPDLIIHGLLSPNDPLFAPQWSLYNWGQYGGSADISARAGWDLQNTATNMLVAVVDSGVRYTHEDLAANMWINPGEIAGNGIDDDHDGYIDDVHGINAFTGSGDPIGQHGHGTHIAGIIGAGGSNSVGIAGVAWHIKIMACQFLDAQLEGVLSDAIECLDYARSKGAKIINASWGMSSYNTQALYDAINSLRQVGILFVAACGNSANNNDTTTPIYPASFDLDNIIAVAATKTNDTLASWSSYGPTTVDLGAPGDRILSCWNTDDSDYMSWEGTSMAAPHVVGVCALVWSRFSWENYLQIKNRVLAGTDPIPALAGKCVTGGRLNLRKALDNGRPTLMVLGQTNGQFQLRLLGAPTNKLVIQSSSSLTGWLPIYTNQTSSSGILDFTDTTAAAASRRFYRAMVSK